MYKMVLNDYRYHWKACLTNIRGEFPLIFVIMGLWSQDIQVRLLGICICLIIISSRMYGGMGEKTFYLLPLNKKERQSYGKTGYNIRVVAGMLFDIVFHIVLLLKGEHQITSYIFTFVAIIIATFYLNIYTRPIKDKNENNYILWNLLAQGTIYLIIIINACIDSTDSTLLILALNIPLLLFQLFILINMYRKYYDSCINSTLYYRNGGAYENNH